MRGFPKSLAGKLENRIAENSLRTLRPAANLIDFSSNDYLGFAQSAEIFNRASEILREHRIIQNGSTGSRLISGNHLLYDFAEEKVARFHNASSALIFNSGYDANIGFFSSVPQRNDVVLYDELCHASIRDGIKLSNAKAFKFRHNDMDSLRTLLKTQTADEIFVVTESVFSMDGDSPPFLELAEICDKFNARLVVDEAHAVGIFTDGRGLVNVFGIAESVFARIITFGKALGCHGAAVLGSTELKEYLVNFARSFVYTTGLSPHSVATIIAAYEHLDVSAAIRKDLIRNISVFSAEADRQRIEHCNIGLSPIITILVPGNDRARAVSDQIINEGFDVRAILSPTVMKGSERLRICMHSFNTRYEIVGLADAIKCALSA